MFDGVFDKCGNPRRRVLGRRALGILNPPKCQNSTILVPYKGNLTPEQKRPQEGAHLDVSGNQWMAPHHEWRHAVA